jgi:hypothetical protein
VVLEERRTSGVRVRQGVRDEATMTWPTTEPMIGHGLERSLLKGPGACTGGAEYGPKDSGATSQAEVVGEHYHRGSRRLRPVFLLERLAVFLPLFPTQAGEMTISSFGRSRSVELGGRCPYSMLGLLDQLLLPCISPGQICDADSGVLAGSGLASIQFSATRLYTPAGKF